MIRFFAVATVVAAFLGASGDAVAAPPPFQIQVIATENGKDVFEAWDRGDGKPFSIEPVKFAPRGKPLSAVVMFRGCQPDVLGNCNVVMNMVAYDPAGKKYGELVKAELWQGKPAPNPGYTQLSRTSMTIVIEPKDLAGTYRITVVARDLIAGTEAVSEARFEVE